MSLSLKIIGYYNHCNVGDEQYKHSIKILFSTYLPKEYKYTIDFYDCDKINSLQFLESDIIIVGGGDVLNSYFINKIYDKFNNKKNLIIALSVGIPYINMLVENKKLHIIDYIFLRTSIDIEMFYKYIGKDRVFYLPDLSILLTKNDYKNINVVDKYNLKNKKVATFCLSRNIYNEKYEIEYYNVIYNISKFVEYLIDLDYHILFLPFNTKNNDDTLNLLENDVLIGDDIGNLIDKKKICNTTFIKETLEYDEIFNIFKITTMCVPMRFHATLFSLYFSVPIISIYTTRKVDNLLKEINWKFSYKLILNDDRIPVTVNLHKLIDIYKSLVKSNEFIKKNYYYNINSSTFSLTNMSKLLDIICKKDNSSLNKINKVDDIITDLNNKIIDFANDRGYIHYKYIKDENLQNIIVSIVSYNLTSFSIYKNTPLNNVTINSVYNYGLISKMFNENEEYDYKKEWKWIINDILHKCTVDTNAIDTNAIDTNQHAVDTNQQCTLNESLFNIEYMDQVDNSGAHRSGWRYVYDNIRCLNNKNNPLHLDLYVDRTFHWNNEINKIIGIIPYKKPWIGFVHHTFDVSFSDYNCYLLLKCPEFIDSLAFCKGIFVLSEYLRLQFIEELKKYNINVPVFSLVHPTECNVSKFDRKLFINNKNKKIIHIGGWLRNIYSFYNLHIPKTINVKTGCFKWRNDTISKVVLKGKEMCNYYPLDNFMNKIKHTLSNNKINHHDHDHDHQQFISTNNKHKIIYHKHCSSNGNSLNCSSSNDSSSSSSSSSSNDSSSSSSSSSNDSSSSSSSSRSSSSSSRSSRKRDLIKVDIVKNNWYKHFYEDLNNKINSITFIEHLENEMYDKLLTENIVFINLVDASAVNTVIECIVRETPIIINKLPSIVELLGEKYPLYFTEDDDLNTKVYELLKNDKKIIKANKYLKRIKKEKFYINNFIEEFKNILKGL